jgi:RNA polymerase sigma factor (sigma-70 family)
MLDTNTRKLIKLYRRTGSTKALSVLLNNHQNSIHYVIRLLTKDDKLYYDRTHEYKDYIVMGNDLLMDLIKSNYHLNSKKTFNNYFIYKFNFLLLDLAKKTSHYKHRSIEDNDSFVTPGFVDTQVELDDQISMLNKHILHLDKDLQHILLLVYYNVDRQSIANSVGVPIQKINSLYAKAIQTLRQQMISS